MIYISIVFGITIPFLIYLQIMNKKLKREIEEKQKALKRVEKLRDSKLNEMSQIISMIAHQWRQPLNNLYLLIQTHIYNYKKGKIDKQAIQYFKENSKKQINLMSKTINDFMEFFKAQENKNYFDLKKTIEELLSIIEPLFKKNNIKISFYYEDNNNYTLNNYKNMFTQIIINILNNAKDALLERNIDNKQIYIELQNNDIELIILIKDNAGGIPEDIIDKVFDPYFSTKNEKNGTGLGLYISKIILEERMNGKIDVKNDRNGAIFKIIFPK
ncbi:Histidine kinase-, DNA gyrase B-, and HSP90-like ATPase [Hydrogenimonas thermophila]|uniref:histidine kinase n=3 Tax=Hydrogenimonas thermophila TaxID=223786 RepID=A0A1I5T643_9BACT|nr:Histidine kinase-, DNA gyrase B-, and HSP90-like ATPase [Hydrogenimonas thermophila]